MIATILFASALLQASQAQAQQGQPQEQTLIKELMLPKTATSTTQLILREFDDPINPAVRCPKGIGSTQAHPWFDWCIQGYVTSPPLNHAPCFMFYSQSRQPTGDKLGPVSRMFMRLWDFNFKKITVIHPEDYMHGVIEVFLCNGGKPGGEQKFDVQQFKNSKTDQMDDVKVNTIYLYDLPSFTDPVEMAREIAHEYGHATLPYVGGYSEPEDWANGFLGEKLYLRWLRDAMFQGELGTFDSMGATKEDLDKWVKANVDPLVEKAALTEPTDAVMSDKSAAGMNECIGLSLYVDTLYSDAVFARSIKMIGSTDPKDYPQAAVLAAEEPENVKLKIPLSLRGKLIWIPLGTGKLRGARIVKKNSSGWVQIQVGVLPVIVSNPR